MSANEWVTIRIRMQDAQRASLEARRVASDIRRIGGQAQVTGRQLEEAGNRGFWLNQALFTVRRTIYGLTLGLGTLASGAAYLGFQFNSSMEQAGLAFETFTGSATIAKDELSFLFDLAAKTPFEFSDLTSATRMLLGFNFGLEESNQLLTTLSDAVAGFGLSQDAIERATIALGQMRSTGKIVGQDLRQLMQLGLFNPEDFQKRLNLPQGYLNQVGDLAIPAQAGIDAIVAYWEQKFGGSAEKFQGTFVGQFTSLRDYAGRLFGTMMQPAYEKSRDVWMPKIRQLVIDAQADFESGGVSGLLGGLDTKAGTDLQTTWLNLIQIGTQLARIGKAVGGGFKLFGDIVHPLNRGLAALGSILWVIATVMEALGPVTYALIALLIAERIATGLVALATKTKVIWDILSTFWTTQRTRALKLWALASKISVLWTWRQVQADRAAAIASTRVWKVDLRREAAQGKFRSGLKSVWAGVTLLTAATWSAVTATWAFTVALLANPITWIVLAIVALIAVLVLLYFKWDWFHGKIIAIWDWIKTHWPMLLPMLAGPLTPVIYLVILLTKQFDWLGNAISRVGRAARGAFGWMRKGASWVGSAVGKIPFMQAGGLVTFPGLALVGEHGPEMVHLPRGASVTPNNQVQGLSLPDAPYGARELVVKIPVMLDSRIIAEEQARVRLDKKART